jgi:hypothetical protein
MPVQSAYHSVSGRPDFLGLRIAPGGGTEIVYDDGRRRRLVWRVREGAGAPDLGDALRLAVNQSRVVPALYSELKKRGVAIEAVAR